MTASASAISVQVPYDARLFLDVPYTVRDDDVAAISRWATGRVAELTVQPELAADPDAAARHIVGQVRLLSSEAAATLLFCPRGLPGDALVEIFVGETAATNLADVLPASPVALPTRMRAVHSSAFGEGRVCASTFALADGSLVGQLRYQWLWDGILVEACATARDLSVLGAGMQVLEELAVGISLTETPEDIR